MRIFAYARVSTAEQADGMSLSVQEDSIRSYCQSRGWDIVEIFTDIGSGADTSERPAYRRMLREISRCDKIVASRLDRLGRDAREMLALIDHCAKERKGLMALDLPMDPFTPIGRLLFTIMASVAEFERSVILERTKSGRMAKAEKMGYAYGAPPLGYTPVGGELVPNPDEQNAIQTAGKLQRMGYSLRQIAARLTEMGYKTKRGAQRWSASVVDRILKRKKRDGD